MYDFNFCAAAGSDIKQALQMIRDYYRKEFSHDENVKMKSIQIIPMIVPTKIQAQAQVSYVALAIFESEEMIVPLSEVNKLNKVDN